MTVTQSFGRPAAMRKERKWQQRAKQTQHSGTPQDTKKENNMPSSEILNVLNALTADGEGVTSSNS